MGWGVEMIVGTGVDLAEVPRIRAAIERHGRRFIERIYTPAEIAYVERKANRYERFAARFAAKEAGMKAIGTGWRRGVRWQDTDLKAGEARQILERIRVVVEKLPAAIRQAHERIIGERPVENDEKVLSLYEVQASVYVRGKEIGRGS